MSRRNKKKTYADIYLHSDKYEEYVQRSTNTTWNMLEGSIRSSKSVANILAFATNILLSPDDMHIVAGTTAAVARAVWLDNGNLGLLSLFEGRIKEGRYEGHSCVEISLPGRIVTVLVLGMKNKGSYKGFRGMSIGMVALTELDLLDQESVIEVIGRTLASKHRRFFFDFNPTSEWHPLYNMDTMYSPDRLLKLHPTKTNYMHCTIEDNPSMTKEQITEAISAYDPDSIPYKRYILGQRVNAEGLIYRVRDYNIIEKPKKGELGEYSRYVIIADPGINSSNTAFILAALTKDRKHIDILKEYSHRNADHKGLAIKMPADYVDDFLDFINDSVAYMGYKAYSIRSDLDVTFKREFERRKHSKGVGDHLMDVVKEEIDTRIKTGINYLYQGRLRFSTDCPETKKAWESVVYDAKQMDKGIFVREDDPIKGVQLGLVDTVEYAWQVFKNELRNYRG